MVTGWYCSKDVGWHYFKNNGEEKTGWIYDGRDWYYLSEGELYTGWKEIANEVKPEESYLYYFGTDGKLWTNAMTPDGFEVDDDGKKIETTTVENPIEFTWDKEKGEKGTLSGLKVAGMPAEFYMLSIAGETSGLTNLNAVSQGDRGRAYGVCQFDYRYDLVGFMRYAYSQHPDLWAGFADYLNYKDGNPDMVYNNTIGNTFINSMKVDYQTSLSDQLNYFRMQYWDDFANKLNAAGFHLNDRHIAVSAAMFSVNVNCGAQPNIYINNLDPNLTDEDMIRGIYNLRNTVFANQKAGGARKGTSTRYRSAEPAMALDLLYGYTTIDTVKDYGGGVTWGGNPFVKSISTIPNARTVEYKAYNAEEEIEPESKTEETVSDENINTEMTDEATEIEETKVESSEYSKEQIQELGPSLVMQKESENSDETVEEAKEETVTETETVAETELSPEQLYYLSVLNALNS